MQIDLHEQALVLLYERGSDGVKTVSADTGEGGRRGAVTSCLRTSVYGGLVCLACLHSLSLGENAVMHGQIQKMSEEPAREREDQPQTNTGTEVGTEHS